MFVFYREFMETNTSTDIGIKPAAGIFPKKLALEEIKPDPRRKSCIFSICYKDDNQSYHQYFKTYTNNENTCS